MLEGKVAIVTGAGGGIGREIALAMALAGAKVVVNDIGASLTGIGEQSATPGEQTRAIIEQRGGTAVTNTDSVAEWESAKRIVATAIDSFGRVDIVVNNAGILRDQIFHKMAPEQWRAVIDVHLSGGFYVSRAAAEHFRAQGGRLCPHDVHLRPSREFRPGELRRGQAGHHRPVKIHRARQAALRCPLQLHRALRLEPHD